MKNKLISIAAVVALVAMFLVTSSLDAYTMKKSNAEIYNGQEELKQLKADMILMKDQVKQLQEDSKRIDVVIDGIGDEVSEIHNKIDFETEGLPEEFYHNNEPESIVDKEGSQ